MLMLRLANPGRLLIDLRGLWMTDVPFNTPFNLGASFGRPFVSTAIEKVRAGTLLMTEGPRSSRPSFESVLTDPMTCQTCL